MGVLSVYHPDIIEYINAKSYEKGKLVHFNLSVMVDDDFMNAVKNNKTIYLHYPVYDDKGFLIKDESKWKIKKPINAKELYEMIIRKAYDNGEPGILFYDNMNRDNNLYYIENIISTNPCFTGDMKILTDKGYKTFKELENKEVTLINYKGEKSKGKIWCSGIKKVIKIKLSNGKEIKCTPNHVFMLNDGTECEARNLIDKELFTFKNKNKVLKVISIKKLGEEKVYDFNEPLTHWGVVNGCVVHNCGEYVSGVIYDTPSQENIPLDKYKGVCNLGSIFLHNHVNEPFTENAQIDYEKLKNTINIAVRFLDNIIDVNIFPLKDFENYQRKLRTIGLGITGLADVLAMLNIKYGSRESIIFVDELMNFIAKQAYKSSIELAKEKGSFEFLDREKFIQSGFIKKHINIDEDWRYIAKDILEYGIRNARILSVAPTGTLSLTYGNNCSSGIEPIFSLEYDRKVKIGGQNDDNEQIITLRDYAYELWLKTKDSPKNIVKKETFVTAMNLSVQDHLSVLKTVAFHVDMSCSKTINLPTDYSFEDTKKVYEYCWENGIKGCTIFRPNEIRQGILLTNNDKSNKIHTELPRGMIYSISDDMIGKKTKLITGCGSLHLQAWFDPITGDIMEVFLAKGSDGGCNSYMIGLSRMISLSLRGGVPIEAIIDQLRSVPSCPSYATRTALKKDTNRGSSCPMAIGNVLLKLQKEVKEELFDDYEENKKIDTINENKIDIDKENIFTKEEKEYLEKYGEIPYAMKYNKCPQCKEKINHVEGCLSCDNCGWTKC